MPDERLLFDLELVQLEKFAFDLSFVRDIIGYQSSLEAEKVLLGQLQGIPAEAFPPTSSQLAATASWIGLYSSAIFTALAQIRLEERAELIRTGQSTRPLYPNINITTGAWISLAGSTLVSIGLQQRADEEAPVTIL